LWCVIAGLGPAFAQQPFGLVPGVVGFSLMIAMIDRADPRRRLLSAFWRGWLSGLAYFLVAIWWVWQAFMVEKDVHGWQAPFAVAGLAAGLALFWGAAAVVYRATAPRSSRRILVFAAVFAVAEWLRGHVLTGFPWDLPGEIWRAGGAVSQSASVIGVYGLTIVTLAMGASPVLIFERRPIQSGRLAPLFAILAFGLLWAGGAARLKLADRIAADPAAPVVRVVQANIPQAVKWDAKAFSDILERHLRLTALPGRFGRPDVVIWSESAIPALAGDYLAPQTWTAARITAALAPDQLLFVGAPRAEPRPLEHRYAYFNSLLAVVRQGEGLRVLSVYDKHHLVPFGEYMPMDALATRLGVKALAHVDDGFDAGPPTRVMTIPGFAAVQPLICYEGLFPGAVRDPGRRARFIVNVSNDAWFGPTTGPLQHDNMARYRAIEQGLPMARATPTGVSSIVDAYGRPRARVGQGLMGVADLRLPPRAPDTLYRRLGEGPFIALVLLSLAFGTPGPRMLGVLRIVAGRRSGLAATSHLRLNSKEAPEAPRDPD
jgi:apolipoprotein N-acyltransferase